MEPLRREVNLSPAGINLHRMVAENLYESAVIVLDPDRVVTDWNPGAARVFGYPAIDAIGSTLDRLYTPEDRVANEPHDDLTQAEALGRAHFRRWMIHANGNRVWVEGVALALRDETGSLLGFGVVVHDKTERLHAEEALRASERHLRTVLESNPECIKLMALDGSVLDMNRAGLDMIQADSLDAVRGQQAFGLVAPEDVVAFREMHEAVIRGETRQLEFTMLGMRGGRRRVATHAVPLPGPHGQPLHLGVTRDVTDQRRLEEQLRQSQKMDAIGQLAGGVAHDFNNILAVIMGFGDLALGVLPPDHPARESVAEMVGACDRAVGLTRQLLAFSRRQPITLRELDLNAIVANMERMLARTIGEHIDFGVRLDPRAGHVRGDSNQIELILLNLVVNARDAMPRGGKITIETRHVQLDEDYTRTHPTVAPGHYVLLAVSDTGIGMSDEVKARIFEPFFTTKAAGKGTGLGLATAYGIVKQFGGSVDAYSERDVGTTFKVYLPRVEPVELVERPAAPASGVRMIRSGNETVLLVEDDSSVRSLTRHILKSGGYTVLESEDGAEALRIAESHQGSIHLLLTDVVMPGLDGRELAARLAELRPGIEVLYTSGYTDDAVVRHGLLDEHVHFIQKPFLPMALLQRIRDILDAATSP